MKKLHTGLFLLISFLGIFSVWETRLSVFTLLLLIIAFAALTRFEHEKKTALRNLLVISTFCSLVGMGRFVWTEALPGIAEARGRASGKKAVSILREILFAQDALRRHAMIDPDGDGIGSAARLGELAGSDGARGKEKLTSPPLAPRFEPRVPTRFGPATEHEGHFIQICLPGKDEEWVSHPSAEVDDEKAERRWVAYAWPAQSGLAHTAAYFIDEHEQILTSENRDGDSLRLVGGTDAPRCNDAMAQKTKALWTPWRGKTLRKELPGDK